MFAFGSLQGTGGSKSLELTVANVGTTGYHCKELPVPRGWNSWFQTSEPWVAIVSNCRFPKVGTDSSQPGYHRLPLQRISGSQRLELTVANVGTTGYHCEELPVPGGWNSWFPTWEPQVIMASNCRLPGLETYSSQLGNQWFPLEAVAASHRLELMFSKVSSYHC